jgi:hypothetical protein
MSGTTTPDRATILKAIRSELNQMNQWGREQFVQNRVDPGFAGQAFKYMLRAEALIALLEVHDCGSYGGYDPACPETDGGRKSLRSLQQRYEWLTRKYPCLTESAAA